MQKDAQKLLKKYAAGNCTEKEKAIVESWYAQLHSDTAPPAHHHIKTTKDEVWASLSANQHQAKKRIITLWPGIAAAVALIAITITFIFHQRQPNTKLTANHLPQKTDITPGRNKAFLTLANGKKISLTDAANGQLVKQSGVIITKTAAGQLSYTVVGTGSSDKKRSGLFNTIETPSGGQYQINLPDGTKVWLNASSSLKYPTNFNADKRMVELNGEAYFEVAKINIRNRQTGVPTGQRLPFIVKTAKQLVEVLGTHFNINSYTDEPDVKTTLLEGSVKVSPLNTQSTPSSLSKLLKPGEQSRLSGSEISIAPADTVAALAWKNGDFVFKGDDLQSIMRKIARWYNVDVVYKGDFTNLKFGGYISRSKDVATVLDIMAATGKVHFVIDGHKIIVSR